MTLTTPPRSSDTSGSAPTGTQPAGFKIRLTLLSDIPFVVSGLRERDREECEASVGDPEKVIPICALEAQVLRTIEYAGEPIALFGVSHEGCIWMVGTPAIEKCQIAFLRASRPWMDSINKKFPLLWNKVDSRNTVHVKWLKWCGFTFYRREQLTPGGPDFLHFARIDAHVC